MISVVVPAYNAEDTLPACLDALQHQTLAPDEIILVDDGSSDETAAIAREYDGVTVLSQKNQGPAAARNLGVRRASGDIVLFTDADCAPAPQWAEALTSIFDECDDIVGAKGTYRTRQQGLVPRFVQEEYAFKYKRMAGRDTIDFIDTYSAAYRRDIFLQNGGFQAVFPVASVEDQEFSFRLARKGYRMVFVPDAVVYHQHDKNIFEYFRRKHGIGYWKAFLLRWLPEKTFSDSHTPASQRWQIPLLGLAGILGTAGLFWPPAWVPAVLLLVAFYLTAIPLFSHIAHEDRSVLQVAPVLLVCRATALGIGLCAGLLHPPSTEPGAKGGLAPTARATKRLLDIIGATIGLAISAPILIIAGIAIKLDSPGPMFFVQRRAGENGRPFNMIKLRTMVDGASEQVDEVLHKNPLNGPVYKVPDDPRVTRIGRVLRRWSIDELPQFWNVLRGDMSLVGPRPEELWVVDQYNDEQRKRLAIKPGLTGPMQVAGRGHLDMNDRLALEMEYIENYSIWRDVRILLRSVPAILTGEGAY